MQQLFIVLSVARWACCAGQLHIIQGQVGGSILVNN